MRRQRNHQGGERTGSKTTGDLSIGLYRFVIFAVRRYTLRSNLWYQM